MAVTVSDPGPAGHATFFVTFRPTRPDWPSAMTADEQRALSEHAEGLAALAEAGTCVVAGPCLDAQLGVCVLDGLPLDAAVARLSADPMVVAGYFAGDVRAMRLSFERERAEAVSEEQSEQGAGRVSRSAASGAEPTPAG